MTVISPQSGELLSSSRRASKIEGYVVDKSNPVLYLINEASGVDDKTFWQWWWGLQYHARYQFGRAWNMNPQLVILPKGAQVPAGGMVMHFTDTLDVSGALGYHDEDGNEVPYARVGVVTSEQDQAAPSAVGAHEEDELFADLHVNQCAINGSKLQVVAYEVGDPCQGNDFDVGAPEGRTTGVMVADFALESWFDENTPADAPTSYTGALRGPFNVGPQGYHSFIDLNHAVQNGRPWWRSAFGQDHVIDGEKDAVNPL